MYKLFRDKHNRDKRRFSLHRRIKMDKNLNEIVEKILRELQDIKVLLQEANIAGENKKAEK